MTFSDFIGNFTIPGPSSFLSSCSVDVSLSNINAACLMELLFFPLVALVLLAGITLCVYMFVWVVYSVLFDHVYVRFLAKALGHTVNLKTMGQWAVVTGATDGIGKAYAEELARLGIDIVLISRTLSKLETVANAIEQEFHVRTKIIAADYTRLDIYDHIRDELEGLEIGILINNVGMSYEFPEYFLEVGGGTEQLIHNLVNCNVMSCFLMTNMLLPAMVDRNRGVILNLSSTAAVYPLPFLNVYSSTKVCVDYFSRSLQNEYRDKGIIIQCVIPFFVATNMSKIKKTSLFVPSPSDYVKCQLKTVGLEDRTFGCYAHKFQGWCLEFMVHFFPHRVTNAIMCGALKNMNKRARIIQAKNNRKA